MNQSTENIVRHTPGPWHQDGATIYWKAPDSGNNWIVAQVVEPPVRPGEEAVANARLIAAAPDGLAVAKFALSVLRANPVEMSERMAIEKLAAFIEKAEGRES